jgi:hypothetical protein
MTDLQWDPLRDKIIGCAIEVQKVSTFPAKSLCR